MCANPSLTLLNLLAAGPPADPNAAVSWGLLDDILILLTAALLLGTLAERLKQSAIIGYLLAGALVGPNVLGWVKSASNVTIIAELGVALLLFTIGLEFSFKRLRRLGKPAFIGGSLQVTLTLVLGAAIAKLTGMDTKAAVAVGAMLALSSTACVIRLLTDRAAVESVYGRNSLAVLLFQDLAVIPLVLIIAAMSGGGTAGEAIINMGKTLLLGGGLVVTFLLLFKFVLPKLFNLQMWARNRELPILLAMVTAMGSAVAAHKVEISPAIGAFVAGVLLGESPFAVQVRADVSSIRTLFVTLFFASVGMFGEPAWVASNAGLVVGASVLVVLGKAAIIFAIFKLMKLPTGIAAATGLCLAQVGEFSFVLAGLAKGTLVTDDVFRLVISISIVTLFLTPFMVTAAPMLANAIANRRDRRLLRSMELAAQRRAAQEVALTAVDGAVDGDVDGAIDGLDDRPTLDLPSAGSRSSPPLMQAPHDASSTDGDADHPPDADIVIIGFGPAGQEVAQALIPNHTKRIIVIELSNRNALVARRYGLNIQVGDATQLEVLEHARISKARVVLIALPDPEASRTIIHQCRRLCSGARIIVRSRYHVVQWELLMAGAHEVIDEERQVGHRLALEAKKVLGEQVDEE